MDSSPTKSLSRIINQTRLAQIKAFGFWNLSNDFWNVSADLGVWRVVAAFRHGKSPGHGSETACALYFSNDQAQLLACQMLGDPAAKLHASINPAICFRSLALALVSAACSATDCPWTEANSATFMTNAKSSATARFLCFDEAEILGIATGFRLLCLAGFGTARFSSTGFARQAEKIAKTLPPLAFDPTSGASCRQLVSSSDLIVHENAFFDVRAAARGLGLPFAASLAAPAMDVIGNSFVCPIKVQSLLAELPDQGFGLGAHSASITDAYGLPCLSHGYKPSAYFQSRQDAATIDSSTAFAFSLSPRSPKAKTL